MPKQILLVDDSVTIHRVVEITFAHEDFAITAAKSVEEGLDKARQLKPDAVLADAGLPGKTGYDLCAALRQDAALAKTPCIILTGNFTPYDEGKGSSSGADGFVVKPFETQALIDKVKDAIARRTGGEVPRAAAAPTAAAPAPAPAPIPVSAPVPAKAGIEALGKPLSSVAAETSARIPAQPVAPAAPARPAPMPVPAAPVAAAPPTGQPARPTPKATLMGIPAVNPAALGITPAPAKPTAPAAPAPEAMKPMPVAKSAPIAVEPPRPAPAPAPAPMPVMQAAPSAPIRVEPPRPAAVAHPTTLPASVPQMPRPSLVPGVATPKPVEAAPARVVEQTLPGTGEGIDAAVRNAAERAAAAMPAAVAAKVAAGGPEYAAIAKLSREVIEQVVWEVVPELAESIIRAELDRLVRERQNA